MLIREVLTQGINRLQGGGVETPRFDAELLLARVLDTNRASILAWPERALTPKELGQFRDLIARRADREPLAYILGHREFFGLDFAVDPRVLIPRPETELLVEHALLIAQRLEIPAKIADVGSGSGAISVSLAIHLPDAIIYALDGSEGALEITSVNAQRHAVADRICCLHSDLLTALPAPVDLITANLPYVTSEEWASLPPEIRNHEPQMALDGGSDGLDLIRQLLKTVPPHLRTDGSILLEIGASQGVAVTELARQHFAQASITVLQDYSQLDRLVVIQT